MNHKNKLIEALGGRIDAEKKISSLALELAESRLAQATSLVEANNALKRRK